jgi:hypothetical protein
MVKEMLVFVVAVLLCVSVLSSCTPGTQLSPPLVVDNQSVEHQSPAEVDNNTTPAKPEEAIQPPLSSIPITLRYDYLNTEENLFSQVAVWHSYATFSNSYFDVAGQFIKSPLIIMPRKEGSVCIIKEGSGGYKYYPIVTTHYDVKEDEKERLSRPGWGLATTFHPENIPFTINNIRIAAVANYNQGILDDYNKKFMVINILNAKSEVMWSKYYKWSDFRSTATSTQLPNAVWRDFAVDNVTVDGDFTIDLLAMSDTYGRSYSYFAVAYEKLGKCGDVATNSFISEKGKRSNPWVRLYNQYGDPVCFNLCIRIDGVN